jgi:glycerophosphoryl diester phosphodiesterase
MKNYLKRRSFQLLTPHKCFIEGHRGVNKLEPENTLKSFAHSYQSNLDGIELDIWLTKDKIPVVIHGTEEGGIEDSLNGIGKIKEMTLEELKKIKTKVGDSNVPTLEEVFQYCKNKLFINIELKDPEIKETLKEVMKLVEKYDMTNQIAFSSFNHEYAEELKNYPTQFEFGYLYEDKNDKNFLPYKFNVSNCSMNVYCNDVDAEFVKKAHERGIAVMCWCSSQNEENEQFYSKLFSYGIDVLCCNEPDKAVLFRNKFFQL